MGDKGGIRHMREGPISGLRFAGFSRRFWPDSGQIRGKRAVRPEVDVIELQTIELLFFVVSMSFIFPSPFSLTLWCPVAGSGERRAMRQDDAYACNTY